MDKGEIRGLAERAKRSPRRGWKRGWPRGKRSRMFVRIMTQPILTRWANAYVHDETGCGRQAIRRVLGIVD